MGGVLTGSVVALQSGCSPSESGSGTQCVCVVLMGSVGALRKGVVLVGSAGPLKSGCVGLSDKFCSCEFHFSSPCRQIEILAPEVNKVLFTDNKCNIYLHFTTT